MAGQPQLLSVRRRFWELIAEGVSTADAAAAVGVSRGAGERWFRTVGGVNPRIAQPQGRRKPRLSHDEREQIMIGTARVTREGCQPWVISHPDLRGEVRRKP
jgi:transposase